jgi:hypothetical protein
MSRLWLCLAIFVLSTSCRAEDQPENVALGATYTLTPPNYSHCTDADDAVQLTDGIYTEGYFWTQRTTVGWSRGGINYITLDLGQIFPISGISFNTAAGVADVRWPKSILIFVSDDGQTWHEVGDLVRLVPEGFLPPYGTYAVRKLTTTALKTHGRYVQLAIEPEGHYCFVDEIEVFRGPREFLAEPLPGKPVADVAAHVQTRQFTVLVQEQLRRDLKSALEDLETADVTEQQRNILRAHGDGLATRINDMPLLSPEGFRAVLPMTDLEREIFAFQAQVWRAQRKPTLRIWHAHRWDYLAPSGEPPSDSPAPAVKVRMMNGEVRADVLNFTNAGEREMALHLRIEGVPGGTNPGYIRVCEVLHVGTRRFVSVAAALPEAKRQGDAYLLTVVPGMTVQAWFEFRPTDLPPGRHQGQIVVQCEGVQAQRVPLELTISPIRFPKETTLLLGGWCYTDGPGSYGVTPHNRDAVIAYLRDHKVNAPWATSAAMPEGTYDADDQLVEELDTSRFDEWIEKWRGSRMYMVFLAKTEKFAGTEMGTEQFAARLGNWAHFWARHMQALGLKPEQLGLLVYDEPHDARGYAITTHWARAIHAAEPDIAIFVDPIPAKPDGMEDMLQEVTIICPQRQQWMTLDWVAPLYLRQQANGRTLWFYSCSGPARSFDPFSYYLLQEWHCFKVGATGSGFWSFTDTSKVSVWNEYLAAGPGPYCPMYLDETSVTSAKWMEAIREGVQDYEYLAMLRDRIAALRAEGKGQRQDVKGAADLLATAADRVLAGENGPNWRWDEIKDRSVADRVRLEVLDFLEKL